MRRLLSLGALGLALFCAGPACGARGAVVIGHLEVDGRDRSYRIFVPATLPAGKPVPVVLLFHGFGGSGEQLESSSGFDRLAASNGFLAVYPDGLGRSWNAGDCCAITESSRADDVAFVDRLLDRLERDYRIDRKRIYAAGHSNGALLSYRLACERAGRFAAIGSVAGTLVFSPCRPSRPISVVAIHGLADPLVPYAGGGPISAIRMSVPDTIAFWRRADACAAIPATTRDGPVTTRRFTGCRRRTAVTLYTIAGAGHAWPGAQGPQGTVATHALDASVVLWRFFAAHPQR